MFSEQEAMTTSSPTQQTEFPAGPGAAGHRPHRSYGFFRALLHGQFVDMLGGSSTIFSPLGVTFSGNGADDTHGLLKHKTRGCACTVQLHRFVELQ